MDDFLTLTHATERDVDLILIEELRCSPDFVRWLVRRVSNSSFDTSSVSHSKRRMFNRREIDITLSIKGASGTAVLLIENKLDTAEQPNQAQSYKEEAKTIVERGEAWEAHTVLVCPERYAASASAFASRFDHVVYYESVIGFLSDRIAGTSGEIQARLSHKRDLLVQATTKARRGYEAVPLAGIDHFNQKYVAMLQSEKIQLEPGPSMLKEGRPGESRTMIFDPSALPKWPFLPQTRLVHQTREANANVNFYTWGDYFSDLAGQIGADLKGTGYRVVPTINKRVGGRSSLMIVAATPPVDSLLSFDDQRPAILEGARVTYELKKWFWANQAKIKSWAEIVQASKAAR